MRKCVKYDFALATQFPAERILQTQQLGDTRLHSWAHLLLSVWWCCLPWRPRPFWNGAMHGSRAPIGATD